MRILYATDGSEGALAAARLLNELALTEQDEIVLFAAANGSADAAMEATAAALGSSPARLSLQTAPGSAASAVLAYASQASPDLIAMGSQGRNAVARFLLGSVAERVVSQAPCPVLVARPLAGNLDRVVVGIDGSETSLQTAHFLETFPLPSGCEVRLVTAIPFYQVAGTPAGRLPSLGSELRGLQQREREEAEARLRRLADNWADPERRVITEFREAHPAAGLLEMAEQGEADLIAVGRQGLSRVERFYMGSVSLNVLRHASCSVLVVPETGRA